ncbi:MAG: putative sulfate exporter family transporter [Chitinophagaceae bacterium]|nr:putative sulfate exporter family transporter [Chitinophagaceae bacterium]
MKKLHEDWVTVILGFLVILLALVNVQSPVPDYNWANAGDLGAKVFSGANILNFLIQFVFVLVLSLIGTALTGKPLKHFLYVFPLVYILSVSAMIIAGNKEVNALNLEAVIFSLTLGLLVSNLFKLPDWFRAALSTELFVKIGLVILGTGVIFRDILKTGYLGLIQAVVVVLAVWYAAYWICQRLKIDKEMTMMISSAVSICGVSAAIATAGAIQGDNKKLSYVISLVLVTAIPMMIGMPYLANIMGLSQEVTGAWLGGSIDTTGAVVASGTLVGEAALKVSTIVKFSQNVLLGLAAFAISVYWTISSSKNTETKEKNPGLKVIWERFPKFVLGFVAASLLFSFVVSPAAVSSVKGSLKNIQTLWFVLAFTSIGLETRFADLMHRDNRKPLYAFLAAQGINILVTLVIAYLLFNGYTDI